MLFPRASSWQVQGQAARGGRDPCGDSDQGAADRKVHSTFQVDQQRLIDAASWVFAYSANAERTESVVMSTSGIRANSEDPRW